MKRFLRRIFPLLMAAAILLSIGWYLFAFNPGFTRELLLQQARRFEDKGKHTAAVWCYNMVYRQFDGSDEVAIEMAQQFKDIGNYSKAEYTLRKALEDGGSKDLYMALSKTYVQQGKLRDAVQLLDHAEEKMREKLEKLRPAAPTVSLAPGSYNEYISVELECDSGTIYVSTDGDYPSSKTDAYTGAIRLPLGETTLYAVCVGDNGLVSALAVFHYTVSDVVEEAVFEDAAFEAVIRETLQLEPDQEIYTDALWEITELTLPADVRSCQDLKWLPGLLKLTVSGSTVDTGMLDAIGSATSLQSLTLSDCSLSSVTALSGLTNLQYLDLSNNAIRDLSSLSAMTGLQHLDLGNNALISLSGLEGLSALTYLDVSYNSLSSVQTVENMAELTYLDLSSNTLRSLEGVENLTKLTHFIAQHNELLNVDALKNCQSLIYLDVSNNTLLDVDAAASLRSLEELYFDHNEVTRLPKFSTGCKLTVISGTYNKLSSLNNLAGLSKLAYVYMDYNTQISSVNSLVNCPKLKEVYVYGTKVKSASVLLEKDVYVVYSPV